MSDTYLLQGNGKTPIKTSLLEWASAFRDSNWRRVGWTEIGSQKVSTVFLGLNHRFMSEGPPILWETMIFGPWWGDGEYQERYTSWDDAVAGHERACRRAFFAAYLGPLHQLAIWVDRNWRVWKFRKLIQKYDWRIK